MTFLLWFPKNPIVSARGVATGIVCCVIGASGGFASEPVQQPREAYAFVLKVEPAGSKVEAWVRENDADQKIETNRLPVSLPRNAFIKSPDGVVVTLSLPKGRSVVRGGEAVQMSALNDSLPAVKDPVYSALSRFGLGGITRDGGNELAYPVASSAVLPASFSLVLKPDWPAGPASVSLQDNAGAELIKVTLARANAETTLVSAELREVLNAQRGRMVAAIVATDARTAKGRFLVLPVKREADVVKALAQADSEVDPSLRHVVKAYVYQESFLYREALVELREAQAAASGQLPRLGEITTAFAAKHGLSPNLD